MKSVIDEIEQVLMARNNQPHNKLFLQSQRGLTPEQATQETLANIRSGMVSVIREDFLGPRLFLRVVNGNRGIYTGEWWFDSAIFDNLETAYSRIYFKEPDKKQAIRDMLREVLAISSEWSAMTDIWAMELPSGQLLRGYSGIGTPQQLFANIPLSEKGNRLLVGKTRQIFFPVKNPLWVKYHYTLTD